MVAKDRHLLIKILKILDITSLAVLYLLMLPGSTQGQRLRIAPLFSLQFTVCDMALFAALCIAWHFVLESCNLYVSRRFSTVLAELLDVLLAISWVTMITVAFVIIFHPQKAGPLDLLLFWATANILFVGCRVALRYSLRQFRLKGRNLRNIVIAGSHYRAMLFGRKIVSKPDLGYRLLGFVDHADAKHPALDNCGYQMVADFESFPEYLRRNVVDEVIICLPVKSHYQHAARITSICEEHGIMVRFLSDIFNPKFAQSRIEVLDGHSIITFYTGQMVGSHMMAKRALDLVLSLLLIVLLSPLCLVCGILIKLSSKGPVFFVQNRLGLNKHHFKIYKFRTMYPDAEERLAEVEHLNEVKGAAFKLKNDPRVTPIGRFLRKTSMDEMPQLFNVLKGEMSLVGPRPLPLRDYLGFDRDWHRRRFSVRPGLTCLWQISGRSDVSFDRWMELDMEYIDNWSLWLDFKILLATVPAVIRGSGAS